MKKIVNICICLVTLFLCTSCFEIYVDNDSSNMFIVKQIKYYDKSSKVKYVLENDNNYRINLYDDVKKYNINDTLVISKVSK